MKNKFFISFTFAFQIALLTISLTANSQTWDFIDISKKIIGRSITTTLDSCYVTTSSNSPNDSGITQKINQNGIVQWTLNHGGEDVKSTFDSGFIIAGGFTYNHSCLKKINKYGNLEWLKINSDSGQNYYKKVIQTIDGGFMVIGYSHFDSLNPIIIAKTDSIGNQIWIKRFGKKNPGFPTDILTINNDIFVIANIEVSQYTYNALLIKLDINGNIYLDTLINTIYSPMSFCKFDNNNIIIAGLDNIYKVDINGNLIWIANCPNNVYIKSINNSDNSNFFVGGSYNLSGTEVNLIGKIDSLGYFLWHKKLPTDYSGFIASYESIIKSFNGGIVAHGYCMHKPDGQTNADVAIRTTKTDSNGGFVGNINATNTINKINIFPNPTNSVFTLSYNAEQYQKFSKLQIFNNQGNLVKEISNLGIKNTLQIDVRNLPCGFYVGKLQSENGESLSFKFVKE